MVEKYLLYLDILGFSQLVENQPERVEYLYEIVDSLNVHSHGVFRTIVFSDTILVYNKDDPVSDGDHWYFVMYSIEFAQDLLYRFIGKELYFRGSLVYGPFQHYQLKHTNCFYGPALIQSYLGEKKIQATGLFIHNSALPRNDIFKVSRFNEDYSFVYLNQSLDHLFETFGEYTTANFPISDAPLFADTDQPWHIAKDVVMLRDIHDKMIHHHDPQVRGKFLATWQMYKLRYPAFLTALETNNFSFGVICPGYDWTKAEQKAYEV